MDERWGLLAKGIASQRSRKGEDLDCTLNKTRRRRRLLNHTQWGYDADVFHFFGPVGTGNINDHSKRLLNDLSRIRFESHERERPLIFIAHSLGGLIVKDVRNLSLPSPKLRR